MHDPTRRDYSRDALVDSKYGTVISQDHLDISFDSFQGEVSPTDQALQFVQKVFENLKRAVDKNLISYSIRAMLRIIAIVQTLTPHNFEQRYR